MLIRFFSLALLVIFSINILATEDASSNIRQMHRVSDLYADLNSKIDFQLTLFEQFLELSHRQKEDFFNTSVSLIITEGEAEAYSAVMKSSEENLKRDIETIRSVANKFKDNIKLFETILDLRLKLIENRMDQLHAFCDISSKPTNHEQYAEVWKEYHQKRYKDRSIKEVNTFIEYNLMAAGIQHSTTIAYVRILKLIWDEAVGSADKLSPEGQKLLRASPGLWEHLAGLNPDISHSDDIGGYGELVAYKKYFDGKFPAKFSLDEVAFILQLKVMALTSKIKDASLTMRSHPQPYSQKTKDYLEKTEEEVLDFIWSSVFSRCCNPSSSPRKIAASILNELDKVVKSPNAVTRLPLYFKEKFRDVIFDPHVPEEMFKMDGFLYKVYINKHKLNISSYGLGLQSKKSMIEEELACILYYPDLPTLPPYLYKNNEGDIEEEYIKGELSLWRDYEYAESDTDDFSEDDESAALVYDSESQPNSEQNLGNLSDVSSKNETTKKFKDKGEKKSRLFLKTENLSDKEKEINEVKSDSRMFLNKLLGFGGGSKGITSDEVEGFFKREGWSFSFNKGSHYIAKKNMPGRVKAKIHFYRKHGGDNRYPPRIENILKEKLYKLGYRVSF